MNKRKIITIGTSIFVVILIIYYVFIAKFIATPDKIIIYHSGKQTELTKDNPLFNKIVSCTDNRIGFNSSLVKLGLMKDWEEKIKNDELGIEFIYSSKQTFRLKNSPFRTFSYTRLFFSIKSNDVNNENHMFLSIKNKNYDGYYNGPISLSSCSNELLNLLKDYK